MSEAQILHTKQFGDLKVVMSFHEPPYHVALLENGAYVDINGLPLNDEKPLRKAIPVEFLTDAINWFRHRHDREEGRLQKILVEPDGSCTLEDGSPITSISQLTEALKPGPMLDAALLWFTKKKVAEEKAAAPPAKSGKKVAAKAGGRKKGTAKLTGGRKLLPPAQEAQPGA